MTNAPVRKIAETSFSHVALLLLLYVFLPSFILSCFLLLRTGTPALAYWISLALLAVLAWRVRGRIGLAGGLAFLLIVIISHVVSWHFFDAFHDSLVYHQPAITRIASGFNPVYDGYMNLDREPDSWSDQATYFPKLTWYFAAAVTDATGDVQMGKAYHLILCLSALFFVVHQTRDEHAMRRILWALAALNPVSLYQYTGYVLDGALASLCLIALFFAHLHFSGKPISREARVMGLISLTMLFCVKTTGFAYGAVIVFCICLYSFFAEYSAAFGTRVERWRAALIRSVKFSLRLGVPLLFLVAILGFAPYLTNLLQGRHIFYPLIRDAASGMTDMSEGLEGMAQALYSGANNRVTRFLFSVASYPNFSFTYPAELKSPFWLSRLEWAEYGKVGTVFRAGGLGPLFFLLTLVSVFYFLLPRGQKDLWLLLTICLMLFVHPHAWYFRYVPFAWILPLVLCLSVPRGKECFLIIPALLAAANVAGTTYMSTAGNEKLTREIVAALEPYRGQYVLLDRSIFQCDGFFDRFSIKQKFANPEQTFFRNIPWKEPRRERDTGRISFGSNIAFEEDIPPLPKLPLIFAEETAAPWLRMSEGVELYDSEAHPFFTPENAVILPEGYWNYNRKIKFYMQVTEEFAGDMEFALTASPREENSVVKPQQVTVYANNQKIGEWLWERPGPEEKTVVIPRKILEESRSDPMRLLTLMFSLSGEGTVGGFDLKFEKMEFRR